MNFANIDIKQAMSSVGITQEQLATALGMRRQSVTRKLSTELPKEEKEKIYIAISDILSRSKA